jgi:hypothetical protein
MKRFWFVDSYNRVKEILGKCEECERERTFALENSKMIPIVANEVLEIIEIDHIGPLPETESGNQYILSVVDLFSKKKWFLPAKDLKAQTTFDLLYQHVFSPFWVPKKILSVQHGSFNADLSKKLCDLLGVQHEFAIPQLKYSDSRHSQTMGGVERANRTIETMLRKFVDFEQKNWDEYVFALSHAENKAICRVHGVEPDSIVFGRICDDNLLDGLTVRTQKDPALMREEKVKRMKEIVKEAARLSAEYREEMQKMHDEKFARTIVDDFKVGDWVLAKRPDSAVPKGLSKSLAHQSLGPFEIVAIDATKNNVTLQTTPVLRWELKKKYVKLLKEDLREKMIADAKAAWRNELIPDPLTEVIICATLRSHRRWRKKWRLQNKLERKSRSRTWLENA